jgi:HJR/Mrr/RecB family endonuclease
MMKNEVVVAKMPEGLCFHVGTDATPVLLRDWSLRGGGGSGGGIGVLLRLRDEGGAIEQDDYSLLIPWRCVATLTSDELHYIGLPDSAPFGLEVLASGAIHDSDFEIRCGFIHADGRRVMGAARQGAWLRVGDKDFLLLDPLYSIVEAIEHFRQEAGADIESKMLRWGQISAMLPSTAIVDGHLGSLRIVVASSFSLAPFINERGEPDFDPVLGRYETRLTETEEEERVFEGILAPARQRDFARRFRGLSRVKHRYAVGAGTYVVLTKDVERALGVVRRAQSGDPDERRDFLENVSGHLRAALDDVGAEESTELDTIFSDEGLSERVAGIGVWIAKVMPWVQRAPEPWLPPEALGLLVGDRHIPLGRDDVAPLLEHVRAAAENGQKTVRFGETDIPVSSATIEALERLLPEARPHQAEPTADAPDKPEAAPDDQVLIVIDNLTTLGYRRERKPRKTVMTGLPPGLETELLGHQKAGLAWLQRHWQAGSYGALLADDMGLGKTLEALAFFAWVRAEMKAGCIPQPPLLVVAPTGLLQNWQDEHAKHLTAPGLGHLIEAYGRGLRALRVNPEANSERGGELATGLPFLDRAKIERADWVLTTYETLRDYQHSFGRVHWSVGVFDEAQKIKNPGARLTEAALAMNIDFTVTMTGTPVENRPADIWSIVDRVEPGWLGTLKNFSQKYEGDDAQSAQVLSELHDTLTKETDRTGSALMLRRLKEDYIQGLPDKEMHRYSLDMPTPQADAYRQVVMSAKGGHNALRALQQLRSISLHPFAPGAVGITQYIDASARLSETFRILENVAARGEKALIFVEAREMQDFLIVALRRRFSLPEDVLVINGTVTGKIRKARVDMFQERVGFDVMVLSPRAGGVGLTLSAANHVVHLSRWWNPAVEDQCTDRVFRIGQKRKVHVYLPIARHPYYGDYSFDAKLDRLLERKRDANRRVLAPTATTKGDIEDLFRSTVEEARDGAANHYTPGDQLDVDLMEPVAFEEWVLRQLQAAGYDVRRTPQTRDKGADGLAMFRAGNGEHTIILQCKHMQGGANCNHRAVEEVLGAIPAYDDIIRGKIVPMVVTNSVGFTKDAMKLAEQKGVRLISRDGLREIRRLRL